MLRTGVSESYPNYGERKVKEQDNLIRDIYSSAWAVVLALLNTQRKFCKLKTSPVSLLEM
jgi:hypothetical protein